MWGGGTGGEKVEMGRGHRWGGSTGGEKVDMGRERRWGEGTLAGEWWWRLS